MKALNVLGTFAFAAMLSLGFVSTPDALAADRPLDKLRTAQQQNDPSGDRTVHTDDGQGWQRTTVIAQQMPSRRAKGDDYELKIAGDRVVLQKKPPKAGGTMVATRVTEAYPQDPGRDHTTLHYSSRSSVEHYPAGALIRKGGHYRFQARRPTGQLTKAVPVEGHVVDAVRSGNPIKYRPLGAPAGRH